jgi:predicted PurR-regulated permease PerM
MTVSYPARMPPDPAVTSIWQVVSRREARLIFWLVVIALLAAIFTLMAGSLTALAAPAIILFVAWLMAYVLEPPVSLLQRHLPFKGRGIPVAITYLVTAVVAIVVIGAAGIAVLNAAVAFIDHLPEILARVRELLAPLVDTLGITLPSGGDVIATIQSFITQYASELSDAITAIIRNGIAVAAGLVTAVIISVGLAVSQVSLLGWLRRFLPTRTYRDLTELERAIAVSFGGFVRGRLLIGLIYGSGVGVAAFLLGIPLGPLIGVIAGLIAFIPWIGPLIAWAVLPAFALVLAPDAVVPAAIVSIVGAVAIQLIVTQLVMSAAVDMSPVAVFVVVIVGTSIAGIIGAVFAIPTAAAILAVTDYLRQRDMLLRSTEEEGNPIAADTPTAPSDVEAVVTSAPQSATKSGTGSGVS